MKDRDTALPHISQFNKNLIANIQGGVIICQFDQETKSSRVVYMSEGWTKLTGYTLQALNELCGGNPQSLVCKEDAPKAYQDYMEQTKNGNSYQLEYRLRHRDGRLIWAMDRGIIMFSADGYNQNQSILSDISHIKESEEKIRISEVRFRIATKASHAAVFEFDVETKKYIFIENPEEIFQAGAKAVIAYAEEGRRKQAEAAHENSTADYEIKSVLQAWYHPEDIPVLLQTYNEMLQNGAGECEARVRQPDGGYIWCRLHQVIMDGGIDNAQRVIGHLTNTDEEHKQTERLRQEAQQDALTRLLNKNAIREMVEQALVRLPCRTYTLLMLDIDNFKGVNDSLGHLFGDAVLMDVSVKLRRLFLLDGTAARIGGDEFIVFLQEELNVSQAAERAEEVCAVFRHTYAGEKDDYKISCSVGVAFSSPGDTYDMLFRKADTALYEAKARGKDQYVVYSDERNENSPSVQNDIVHQHQSDGIDSGKLKIKERIFELLYDSVDFGSSINMILSLLGQMLEVSRVYIMENSQDNVYSSCIYEWCAQGVLPVMMERRLPIAELNYLSQFNENGILRFQDMSGLSLPLMREYEIRGIKSTFQAAIMEEGRIQGFMGYDSIDHPVSRASEEVDLMIFAAKVTGTFIIKKRADEKVRLYNQNKVEALDQLPCMLYVIDEAYDLHYVNNIIMDIYPAIQMGQKCHEIFLKRDTPCPDCPAVNCRIGPCCGKIYNPFIDMEMVVTVSVINWSGRDRMRLVCCQFDNFKS